MYKNPNQHGPRRGTEIAVALNKRIEVISAKVRDDEIGREDDVDNRCRSRSHYKATLSKGKPRHPTQGKSQQRPIFLKRQNRQRRNEEKGAGALDEAPQRRKPE